MFSLLSKIPRLTYGEGSVIVTGPPEFRLPGKNALRVSLHRLKVEESPAVLDVIEDKVHDLFQELLFHFRRDFFLIFNPSFSPIGVSPWQARF